MSVRKPGTEDHSDDPRWVYDDDEGWQRRQAPTPEAVLAEAHRDRIAGITLKYRGRLEKAGTDQAAIEAADRWYDQAIERADQSAQSAQRRSTMPNFTDQYKAAEAALTTGLVAVAEALQALDAKAATGEITERFAASERQRLLIEAKVADGKAGDLLRAYRQAALAEARARRAAAEVGDAASVTADELLRARLLSEPYDGARYAEQAEAMLLGGQPGRARILAEVAAVKGAHIEGEFTQRIETALDESVPDRKAAREIEQAVESNAAAYEVTRAQALSTTLGMDAQGNVGDGSLGQRTSAGVAAKVGAFATGQKP